MCQLEGFGLHISCLGDKPFLSGFITWVAICEVGLVDFETVKLAASAKYLENWRLLFEKVWNEVERYENRGFV